MWTWMLLGLAVAATTWLVYKTHRSPALDEDRCPYKIGTDRVECVGPCEAEPPCLYL